MRHSYIFLKWNSVFLNSSPGTKNSKFASEYLEKLGKKEKKKEKKEKKNTNIKDCTIYPLEGFKNL